MAVEIVSGDNPPVILTVFDPGPELDLKKDDGHLIKPRSNLVIFVSDVPAVNQCNYLKRYSFAVKMLNYGTHQI